jgi:hypothetical protein
MLESRIHKILSMYGSQIVVNLQRELRINNNIATGRALESLRYVIEHNDGEVMLNIIGEHYIKKIDEGRKPGKRAPSTNTIEKWIKAKRGFQLRDRSGRFIAKTQSNIKRAAFNIARSIGEKGTRPYNLIEYAMNPLESKILGEVVTAFVEEELNKMIKNKTITI